MKQILIIYLLIFFKIQYSFSQDLILDEGQKLKEIDFCQSTKYDVHRIFGKNHTSSKINDESTWEENGGNPKLDVLFYEKLGVSFILGNDNELISSIQLVKPFKGLTQKGLKIEIGKTILADVFNFYGAESIKLSTTGASEYFYAIVGSDSKEGLIFFYIKKSGELFKEYDKERLIEFIEISRNCYQTTTEKGDLECERPLYALDTVNHTNCFEIDIHPLECGGFMAPANKIYHGLFKTYHSNHKLKEEGNYRRGIKIGVWKYYDENGKMINQIDYKDGETQRKPICWMNALLTLLIFCFILIIFGIPFIMFYAIIKSLQQFWRK